LISLLRLICVGRPILRSHYVGIGIPGALRRDPNESFFLGAAISGAHDHDARVELSDPSHPWLYVSTRYEDFQGKVKANKIVRCFTKEGEWMKKALKAGSEDHPSVRDLYSSQATYIQQLR
jgi:hypothetical protein